MSQTNNSNAPEGKLGVLIVGLGAVTSTFLAGVKSIIDGHSSPIGSLALGGKIKAGPNRDQSTLIGDLIPLADLRDMEFLCWDLIGDNAYEAAVRCNVLEDSDLAPVKDFLSSIRPAEAVYDPRYIRNLKGDNIKGLKTHRAHIEALQADIKNFMEEKNIDRCVMIWSASTEAYAEVTPIHSNLAAYEKALDNNDPLISPSQLYAYAALDMGIGFMNGAPNLSVDFPAMVELAQKNKTFVAGKDYKTGQTLLKTILAPGLKARMLGLNGWFSTNILGNRDGEVLDDPNSFKTKEVSKLSVLESVLEPDEYPDLYKDFYHKVRIDYYPPRGDNKEGWDNIDMFGWMGYPMQIKVNLLARDSILAAPIMLDLIMFGDFAQREGMTDVQDWLSFYFKSPQSKNGQPPEHDLFRQLKTLEDVILTHAVKPETNGKHSNGVRENYTVQPPQ